QTQSPSHSATAFVNNAPPNPARTSPAPTPALSLPAAAAAPASSDRNKTRSTDSTRSARPEKYQDKPTSAASFPPPAQSPHPSVTCARSPASIHPHSPPPRTA